jgi:signal transduction histidine kinase
MDGFDAHRPTFKVALLVGFGLTVGLWVFTGYDIANSVTAMQREANEITSRYTRAQELLSTVRAQVLLGSVYVRDALLDPDPKTTEGYQRRLTKVYDDIDAALMQYVSVFDSEAERQRLDRFHQELDRFQATILDVLATDRAQLPKEARTLLNERVLPRRAAVIRLSEDVQALNRRSYIEQRNRLGVLYAGAQRTTWRRLGVAIGTSLAIVLLATLYAGRLERRLREQLARDLLNTRELQRLSTKLITAQEEERRLIARELHDEIGQVLTAIKVELAHVRRRLGANGAADVELESVQSIADGALQTVRDLSRLLHPAVLDDLGLQPALESYLQGFRRRHGMRVDLQVHNMETRLPAAVEAAAYRIVQEALTNVVRHAQATSCHISLQHDGEKLAITIEDNGRGFPAASDARATSGGLGLIGVRERVVSLHGSVKLDRAAEGGAKLVAELPCATLQVVDVARA